MLHYIISVIELAIIYITALVGWKTLDNFVFYVLSFILAGVYLTYILSKMKRRKKIYLPFYSVLVAFNIYILFKLFKYNDKSGGYILDATNAGFNITSILLIFLCLKLIRRSNKREF